MHILAIPLSFRHEKLCQILERLFVVFHCYKKILCMLSQREACDFKAKFDQLTMAWMVVWYGFEHSLQS